VLGVAVLIMPLVGVWVVVAELRFGLATERLARQLDEPAPELRRTPAGRVDRAAADALFAECRRAAESAPDDWRAWFRLAEAYDLAGDRRRARAAMRRAIALAG
jgi:cytochrome c-type biogenesis protein CcmH/NrfG